LDYSLHGLWANRLMQSLGRSVTSARHDRRPFAGLIPSKKRLGTTHFATAWENVDIGLHGSPRKPAPEPRSFRDLTLLRVTRLASIQLLAPHKKRQNRPAEPLSSIHKKNEAFDFLSD
jgi:hypothetical protein